MEGARKYYNEKYEVWMPWVEDQYLYYFGKDNKASYVAKGTFFPLYLLAIPLATLAVLLIRVVHN